jgi:hypothetical protein
MYTRFSFVPCYWPFSMQWRQWLLLIHHRTSSPSLNSRTGEDLLPGNWQDPSFISQRVTAALDCVILHTESRTICTQWWQPWVMRVPQLIQKFHVFSGTCRFITVFTTACHLSTSCARSIQSQVFNHISLKYVLICSISRAILSADVSINFTGSNWLLNLHKIP